MGQETLFPAPPAITIPPVPAQTYIHHTTLSPRPKLILIGDSITELGSSHAQGWVTSLGIRYNRRMDVVNRGMNGYNSRWGAAALPLILEEILGPASAFSLHDEVNGECSEDLQNKKQKTASDNDGGECLKDERTSSTETTEKKELKHPQYTFVIGYGANDSCLPDSAYSRNHVPLEDYSSNLKRMIQMIQKWNANKVSVALLTPPPCNTEIQKGRRDNENVTKLYADACIEVASGMNVPVVDLWRGMQLPIIKNKEEQSSFTSEQQWKIDYLSDGLHLTPMGNYRLYELVVEVLDGSADTVEDENPLGLGLAVAKLPRSYPDHSMVDANEPEKTFDTDKTKFDNNC